jgi:hypothetical protein
MLKFLTILKVGMKAIARNKLRSTLTRSASSSASPASSR